MNWTCDKEVLKEDGVSRTAATTKETEWERQCQKETDCEQDKEISERNSVNRTKKKKKLNATDKCQKETDCGQGKDI